jgi:hypothetical protein
VEGRSSTGFILRIEARHGANYLLQESADLKLWTDRMPISHPGGRIELDDLEAVGSTRRFYRLRSP